MKKYVFKPYSGSFPLLFKKEKERIAPHLPQGSIEHVGSTAIPGLGGKGIIDIAIAVEKSDMDEAKGKLQALGYEFRSSFSTSERFYFIAYLPDPEEGERRYQIHLTYPGSKEWKELIGFRDYLRHHPEEAREYAELKKQAAQEADQDGKRYQKMKEPMFKKVHELAGRPILRRLQRDDIEILGDLHFPWSTRQATAGKWTRYFEEQAKGDRIACIVQLEDKIAGYGHLLRHSEYASFRNQNIPEINDVWIFEEHRKKGIGTLLVTHLESLAKQEGYGTVGLGVGLYQDYGPAQRLYYRLGYQPDGKGITYKHSPVVPGESYPVDDDLILWLTKRLSS